MASAVELFGQLQDILAAVTQELLVLFVFFLSLALWKYIGRKSNVKKLKTLSTHSPQPAARAFSEKMVMVAAKTKAMEPQEEVIDEKQQQAIRAAETQMMKLLEQREFTRALNYFRTFERDNRDRYLSESCFSAFIQSAIRVGKIDVVERLLRSLRRRGTRPSQDFWRTTLKMLSSRKHFNACLTVHSVFGDSLPADKVVFSCLINGALESGAPEKAATMLDRYREAGIEPRDFVLLFRTYVATNDLEAAVGIFRELGESMTSLMLNLLLLTCVNVAKYERALELLHEARDFEKSRALKNRDKEEERIVDVVSYNTVIKGFAQSSNLRRCFDCLHEMRAEGLEPDDVTFGTLLDTCISDNDLNAANEVVDLLMHGDRPVDTVMCTLFIKGLVRAQRLPKAMELYEEMKRKNCDGARPDIVTYSVLIKAFVDAHDLEKALLLVDDMATAGHRPDDIILTHLLEGCRYVGNHTLGKRLFQDMLAAGVRPSEFTLITMVKLHGRCGAHDEAYQLVAKWEKEHGFKPSVIHYTCLMSGCLRTKNYDQAWQAFKLMQESDIKPDETTVATLLPGMVAAQHWERVLSLATLALKSSPIINIAPETLNNALSQMRMASGQGQHADLLQQMMQDANVRINLRGSRRP
jgi:pentatricopeptide repeat protein